MKLIVSCAMCGPGAARSRRRTEIEIDTEGLSPDTILRKVIEDAGWIVQINGENFDIYCCKGCAE